MESGPGKRVLHEKNSKVPSYTHVRLPSSKRREPHEQLLSALCGDLVQRRAEARRDVVVLRLRNLKRVRQIALLACGLLLDLLREPREASG